ncbi:MAG: lysine exporter LysO family protein [Firmicutes bacterium]|nr:lysine exporter LysO family protein [Bacillota bacterium]
MTWLILITLVVGIFSGPFLPESLVSSLDGITTFALCLLIFGIGIDLGRERQVLSCLRKEGVTALVIPLLVAVGSLAGTYLYSFFSTFSSTEAVAVGAGFGWYSLTGPLLSQLHSAKLGAVGFLANTFRELISIVIIPLVAKKLGHWAAIAPSGAAAMDVTLPLITRATDPETAVLAFVSGVVLSLLVPIVVPLIIQLG